MILELFGVVFLFSPLAESCASSPKPPPTTDPELSQLSRVLREALGGSIYVDQRLKTDRGNPITLPTDLACTEFSPTRCRWRNNGAGRLTWLRGQGVPDLFRLRPATGTSIVPTQPFAIAVSSNALPARDGAVMVSDPIPCQYTDGDLRIKYWTSPLVQLFVCLRRVGKMSFDYCSPPISSGDPGPAFVNIPGPLLDPFELVIEARNFVYRNGPLQGGFVIIDDIEYVADLCAEGGFGNELATSKPFKQVSKRPEYPKKEESACRVLSCNFQQAQCVDYVRLSAWKIGTGPVGNPLTGIRGDASVLPYNPRGTYAYAKGPGSKLRLETPPFTLPVTRYLQFSYYKASAETSFEVFAKRVGQPLKSIFRAPYVNRDSRRWFKELRQLLAGSYEKLIFEADNLQMNNFIGLDEIQLVAKQGQALC